MSCRMDWGTGPALGVSVSGDFKVELEAWVGLQVLHPVMLLKARAHLYPQYTIFTGLRSNDDGRVTASSVSSTTG